jgi:hypothetical protein
MRATDMRAMILILLLTIPGWAGHAFGTWKLNSARSTTGPDPRPRSVTIRNESHAGGEGFTMDRIEADRRATASSASLYRDGQAREFHDVGSSGNQSSRRIDGQTVEIRRKCDSGARVRFVRRLSAQPNELILEVMGARG